MKRAHVAYPAPQRAGEAPALELSDRLYALGLKLGRLKTGTPARLDGKSIDWSGLEMQMADEDPVPFSFLTEQITTPQIACGITTTTAATNATTTILIWVARSAVRSELFLELMGRSSKHPINLPPERLDCRRFGSQLTRGVELVE